MNDIKVIKNQTDYNEALESIEKLIGGSPDPNSVEGEKLNLLVTLVRDYESHMFPIDLPDPIEAIKFKMEQKGLKPNDLVKYFGSRGRVSEILSGKRQLTLDMIRMLEAGLGIPAKVLIQKPDQNVASNYQHWDTQLVKAMENYGYFGTKSLAKYGKEELLKKFFSSLENDMQLATLFRKNKNSYRTDSSTHKNALNAWIIRVLEKAKKIKTPVSYRHGVIDLNFMRDFMKLSIKENGPILACENLKKIGIKLVIEPHLPKTYLDGAVVFTEKNPVIGITVRYDRLGNFWFTLMHELAHVARHYGQNVDIFFDENLLEKGETVMDIKELEADEWAGESILPESKWEISNAKITPTAMAAQSLANELGVHVAVIAGVIQYKHQNFFYLNKIIKDESAKVKKYFPDVFKLKTKI